MRNAVHNLSWQALAIMAALFAIVPTSTFAVTRSTDMSSVGIGYAETELGDLVADAIRANLKTDIAFITAGEMKEVTLPKGEISSQDIINAITYRNDTIVILTLRGEQIKQALERSLTIYPQKNLGFLQVSGLRFTFDPSKPKESRVISITVDGSPLDPARTYSVGVTNSLANGALGYFRIWGKGQITSVTKTSMAQAVQDYLQANPRLDYRKGRITIAR
ncbi:MAG: 5'-nucleotidase C-terminal domain-containing protein [Armatimonadota bacterium]|nr:5'-nucleotidase C-terminal domain-containing protein [Armatimonadota bacterium]